MKNFFRLLFLDAAFLLVISVIPAWAGPESQLFARGETKAAAELEKPSIDLFSFRSSYVFESDLENDGNFGEQDVWQNQFEYGHRFLLKGNLYLRAGVAYERFDFGESFAPVPDHLQSLAGVIGLDYMHGDDVGAFIQFRPGFYTENDFDSASFDVPTILGRIFVLRPDELYLFVGARAAFLSGKYPVIPLAGLIYRPNQQWAFDIVVPEPRIIYSPTKNFGVFLGGEVVGGSYRTDHDGNIFPTKLDGAQIDYTDYRAGGGIIFSPCKALTIDVAGGYSIQRSIDYDRADEEFKTDPAPYLRISVKAEF
ncbi:MAG: hypothetical protein ABJB22_02740 [Verrucomicrobiota bacterium]